MRQDIEFKAGDGTILRGWLYRPPARPAPLIVMSHGFSAVKEMHLDAYAPVFAQAGLAALVYDHRNFGASDGAPRQEADPQAQIADMRDAISFAQSLDGIDPLRIGLWGSSYSGGHALAVAAADRRVKCIVSQVPLAHGHDNVRQSVPAHVLPAIQAMFAADRAARYRGEAPATLPVVNADPTVPAALAGADSYKWFTETAAARAPAWRNDVTLRSVELYTAYEPAASIAHVSPTPLLMLVARDDVVAPTALALKAYANALEPKSLVLLEGGHFDAYTGPGFAASSAAARDWFARHLISQSS